MAKQKRLLVKEKRAMLDRMLEIQEATDKVDASITQLQVRRNKLVSEALILSRQVCEDSEIDGRVDAPIIYKGKVFQINWSGPIIETATEM